MASTITIFQWRWDSRAESTAALLVLRGAGAFSANFDHGAPSQLFSLDFAGEVILRCGPTAATHSWLGGQNGFEPSTNKRNARPRRPTRLPMQPRRAVIDPHCQTRLDVSLCAAVFMANHGHM